MRERDRDTMIGSIWQKLRERGRDWSEEDGKTKVLKIIFSNMLKSLVKSFTYNPSENFGLKCGKCTK